MFPVGHDRLARGVARRAICPESRWFALGNFGVVARITSRIEIGLAFHPRASGVIWGETSPPHPGPALVLGPRGNGVDRSALHGLKLKFTNFRKKTCKFRFRYVLDVYIAEPYKPILPTLALRWCGPGGME